VDIGLSITSMEKSENTNGVFGCRILQVVSLSTLAIHVGSAVRPVVGQL